MIVFTLATLCCDIQVAVMRPPNYTLLMIWVPVILLGSIIGYMKRENLHIFFNTKYWAAAAMVSSLQCCCTCVCISRYCTLLCISLFWINVETDSV